MPGSDAELSFVRLRASGNDRAKFLHNFCTNNIKTLLPGFACEAFFTDVKARTLGHGYVLAFEGFHEVWMLPGDPVALNKHLNRYIITEDVTISIVESGELSGTYSQTEKCRELLGLPPLSTASDQSTCFTAAPVEQENKTGVTGLCFRWSDQDLVALTGARHELDLLARRLAESGVQPLSTTELEQRRVAERYPVIGKDMFLENMAPEAERNTKAVSYTKGCYLGQEPIARLDAMGHVNRALRVVELSAVLVSELADGTALTSADGATVGSLSSVIRTTDHQCLALAMVRVAMMSQELFCTTSSGERVSVTVQSLR